MCLRGVFITLKPLYSWLTMIFKKKNTVRFKQVKNLYFSIIGYKFGVRCPKKRGVQIKQVFKWYKTVINKTGLKKSVRFSEVSGLSRCPVLRFLCSLFFRTKQLWFSLLCVLRKCPRVWAHEIMIRNKSIINQKRLSRQCTDSFNWNHSL